MHIQIAREQIAVKEMPPKLNILSTCPQKFDFVSHNSYMSCYLPVARPHHFTCAVSKGHLCALTTVYLDDHLFLLLPSGIAWTFIKDSYRLIYIQFANEAM